MSFPPYQCFRTVAVWKHFSIYPSPQVGNPFLTTNSYISSRSSLATCPWKKSSRSACSSGATSPCSAICITATISSGNATNPNPNMKHNSRSAKSIPPLPHWTFSAIFPHHPSASRASAKRRPLTKTSRKCRSPRLSPATTITKVFSIPRTSPY